MTKQYPVYEVKPVCCDYGLYMNGELLLITNTRKAAEEIKEILEKDDRSNGMC